MLHPKVPLGTRLVHRAKTKTETKKHRKELMVNPAVSRSPVQPCAEACRASQGANEKQSHEASDNNVDNVDNVARDLGSLRECLGRSRVAGKTSTGGWVPASGRVVASRRVVTSGNARNIGNALGGSTRNAGTRRSTSRGSTRTWSRSAGDGGNTRSRRSARTCARSSRNARNTGSRRVTIAGVRALNRNCNDWHSWNGGHSSLGARRAGLNNSISGSANLGSLPQGV
jgi:hypothetical protein